MLKVWDIFETTTSEVVNDESVESWTCILAIDIPMRHNSEVHQGIVQPGRWSPTKIYAQLDNLLLPLSLFWLLYS
jgi:hypothetical protein